jgi:hypothetical protein
MQTADGRTWEPRWAMDPTRTTGIIALPSRPTPTALLLDDASLATLLLALATMRGQMLPAPTAWATEATLRLLRRKLLAP